MGTERVGSRQFHRSAPDWQVISLSGAGAWFDSPSHAAGAALVRRIADLLADAETATCPTPYINLRDRGVQVWIPAGWTTADLALAQAISTAAVELSLSADPSVSQEMEWGIDTLQKPTLLPFWQTVLGYQDTPDDDLLDPLRRDPRVWFHPTAARPLRDRIHFDVSVPAPIAAERAATVTAANGTHRRWAPSEGQPLLTDAEGNEVDLVPADQLSTEPGTEDWWLPFGGMVFYPTDGPAQSAELAERVSAVTDRTGLSLMIDIRGDGVLIDTGKDRWEDRRFPETAREVQAAARDLGLVADPSRLRFIQVCIDAVDVPAVREFWRAVLGYRNDPREMVTDIIDPRRLNRPMIFQQMDPQDRARRDQRNRIHLDLFVPEDQVDARIETALAAGGRITREGGATIADPEGNEVDIGNAIA